MAPPRRGGTNDGVLRGIAVTVTAVWVMTVIVQVIDPVRQVPGAVNYAFGIAVSALLGSVGAQEIRKRRNGNGEHDA